MGNLRIVILAIIITSAKTQYTVSKLDNSGILFENVGNVLFFKDEWRIFTTIKLDQFQQWYNYVDWSDSTIIKLCEKHVKINANSTCYKSVGDVHYISKRVKAMLDRIQTKPKLGKSKRSIFDGVGKLSKFLFGTMDAEDSGNIYAKLQNLEVNGKENLELLKEQVTIVKSNFDVNKENFEKLNNDLNETKNTTLRFLNVYEEKMKTISSDLQQLQIKVEIEEVANSIALHLQEIEHQIENILITINSLSDGHLHPLILSYEQIAKLFETLPLNSDINPKILDIYSLQRIVKVESTQVDSAIICKISIPMILKDSFVLKKIYVVPVEIQPTVFVNYEISEEYIAANEEATKMVTLNQFEIDQCKRVSLTITNRVTVCRHPSPTYTSPENVCVLLLLFKKWSEANKICRTSQISHLGNTFTKLYTQNSWLFSLQQSISIQIKCPNFENSVKLSELGILTLQNSCEGEIQNLILTTSNSNLQNISFEQPEIEIPKIYDSISNLTVVNSQENKESLNFKHFYEYSTLIKSKKDEFSTLLYKIDQTQKDQEKRKNLLQNNNHTIIFGIFASLLVIFVIILIVIGTKKLKRERKPNTTIIQLGEFKNESVIKKSNKKIAHTPSVKNAKTNPKTCITEFEIV